MEFSLTGLSYRSAPIALREKAAFSSSGALAALEELEGIGAGQCLILSTCNRSEIYAITETPGGQDAVRAEFAARVPGGEGCLFTLTGRAAVEYLFRVTAGLDSMVLGEDQILGQVAQALEMSRAAGCCGKELGRIFQNALAAAKGLRSRLHISEQPLSLCYIGIQALSQTPGGLAGQPALVAGSGQMAGLALRYLAGQGAAPLTVCSRTEAHARALAGSMEGVRVLPFSQRHQAAAESRVVVSATASPHLIFTQQALPALSHPLTFLDLAIPRDVDPALADRPGVQIFDVDSLKETSRQNLEKRQELAQKGEELLAEGVEETLAWLAASRVDGGLEALGSALARAEADTLALLCDRLELSGHQARLAGKILHAGFRRLQKQPVQVLKGLEDPRRQEEYTRMLTRLFGPEEGERSEEWN